MAALNRKETYSGSMVIFTGVYYFIALFKTLFQFPLTHALYIFTVLKLVMLVALYIGGGLLFFLVRPAGWMIAAATLLNLFSFALLFLFGWLKGGHLDRFAMITLAFTLLCFMAVVFLFTKKTRIKYRVNNESYLMALGLLLLMKVVSFFL